MKINNITRNTSVIKSLSNHTFFNKKYIWCYSVTPNRKRRICSFWYSISHSLIIVCSDICRSRRWRRSENYKIRVALSWWKGRRRRVAKYLTLDVCHSKLYSYILIYKWKHGRMKWNGYWTKPNLRFSVEDIYKMDPEFETRFT